MARNDQIMFDVGYWWKYLVKMIFQWIMLLMMMMVITNLVRTKNEDDDEFQTSLPNELEKNKEILIIIIEWTIKKKELIFFKSKVSLDWNISFHSFFILFHTYLWTKENFIFLSLLFFAVYKEKLVILYIAPYDDGKRWFKLNNEFNTSIHTHTRTHETNVQNGFTSFGFSSSSYVCVYKMIILTLISFKSK